MTAIEEKIQILNDKFATLLQEYADILRRAGTYLHSQAAQESTTHFQRLDFNEQTSVLQRVQLDLDLLGDLLDENRNLMDTPMLIEAYMAKAGHTVAESFLDRIERDDIVCLQDLEQRQLFQSLRFFDFITVSLDELFCISWFDQSHIEEGFQLLRDIKWAAPVLVAQKIAGAISINKFRHAQPVTGVESSGTT